MQYRKLTTALIATLALFITSCRSNKTITSQASNHNATDTLCQTILLTLHDTVRETTTITIQTNTDGDTTRITTLLDRQSITTRNHAALQDHHATETAASTQSSETIASSKPTLFPLTPTTQYITTSHPIKRLLPILFFLSILFITTIKTIRRHHSN